MITLKDELISMLKKRKNNEIVFAKNDKYMDVTSVGNIIHITCKKYMNYSFDLYMCRHSFAESLLKNGVDPRTVQELMGHAYYTTSVNYGQSSLKDKKRCTFMHLKSTKK